MQRNHPKNWRRRAFLSSLGLSAAALPFIPRFGSAKGPSGCKRFIIFATTTGMTGRYPANWAPQGGVSDFTLSPILEPLAGGEEVNGLTTRDLTGKCNFLQGVDMPAYLDSPSVGGHPTAMGCMLSATPNLNGDMFTGGGQESGGWGGGISIDQRIAAELGKETPFSSLELGVANFQGLSHLRACMSYAGPEQPLPVQSDPIAAFDTLFASGAIKDPAERERIRAEKLSVIDFVKADLDATTGKLGASQQAKVEAHLAAIRGIEQRIASDFVCTPPELDLSDFEASENGRYDDDMFPIVGRLQMDILIQAMACGLTRVGSLLWGTAPYGRPFNWAPGWTSSTGLHELSHAGSDVDDAQDNLQAAARWYAQQYTYLCQRLDDIPEPDGDGSMLDNTVVLWCTENSKSNNHSPLNMPYVLAGSGGGALETGRNLSFDSQPNNRLFVSIAQAMGLEIDEFGLADYGTGTLTGLS